MSKIWKMSLCVTFFVFAIVEGIAHLHAAEGVVVPANAREIQYTGRIDYRSPKAPAMSWPGSYLKLKFYGSSISLVLDDQYGKNYFSAFVDEDFSQPLVIDCKKGEFTYVIAENLKKGEHTLTLYKRTEGEEGRTQVKGFLLSEGGRLIAPPPRPTRRIEFYGDSITSGMGNEAPMDARDDLLSEKNNFLSYSSLTARMLGAEHVTISQSGIGIMVSWFDFTMPDFYDQLDAVGDNDSRWDFKKWTPQVVVVNLFQNDSWLVEKRLDPVPTAEQRIQSYVNFLSSLRGHYPEVYIVALLGSMDATKEGSPWPGYIEEAISRLQHNSKEENMASLFFPFEGYGKHPRLVHHKKNAERLAAFIDRKMANRW